MQQQGCAQQQQQQEEQQKDEQQPRSACPLLQESRQQAQIKGGLSRADRRALLQRISAVYNEHVADPAGLQLSGLQVRACVYGVAH